MFKYIFCNVCICTLLRSVNVTCISVYAKRDCLLFSVNVKLFFDFFVLRENANYFCVKVFSEEV